MEGELFNRLDL